MLPVCDSFSYSTFLFTLKSTPKVHFFGHLKANFESPEPSCRRTDRYLGVVNVGAHIGL